MLVLHLVEVLQLEDWEAKVNSELVRLVPGSGIDPDKPLSKGDRDITAAFAEFQIPITKTIELNLQHAMTTTAILAIPSIQKSVFVGNE